MRFENKEMHAEAKERKTSGSSIEPFRHGSGHYGWIPSDVALVSFVLIKVASTSSWNAANTFSVPISVVVIPHLLPLMRGLDGHL